MPPAPRLDLVGKIINGRKITKYLGYVGRRSKFEYVCVCGKTKRGFSETFTRIKTNSCRCLDKTDHIEIAYNQLMARYKASAKQDQKTFEIDFEDFKKLVNQNCFYCNDVPKKTKKYRNARIFYNGLDKIDPTKSYTIDNCKPCCWRCNEAKSNYQQTDFINWVERVYKNMKKKEETK